MELWLWVISGTLAVIAVILALKIRIMKKSVREIEAAFSERLMTETNTLIDLSSRDEALRSFANSLNHRLSELYCKRRLYSMGDTELKNAVTNISHDLRTPLTAICGYLDLLENEEKSESDERYLSIIRERVDALKELTEELFVYSTTVYSPENEKPSPVRLTLNAALEESIASFYAVFKERGIEPDVTITETKIVRNLDPSMLSRIFQNILSNALKYSSGDLEVSLGDDGVISFINSAHGLDRIEIGRLFERFYTVETAGKSTGLGLSIARRLTEKMNGSIQAEYSGGKLIIRIIFI